LITVHAVMSQYYTQLLSFVHCVERGMEEMIIRRFHWLIIKEIRKVEHLIKSITHSNDTKTK